MKIRLLFLSMLALVFLITCSLLLSTPGQAAVKNFVVSKFKEYSPIPILVKDGPYPVLSAQAVLALDLSSGVSLYEKEPDRKQLPASTTKIVTALVAMDFYKDDVVLEVKNVKIDGQKMGLQNGEKMTVKDLLYGLLVYSANDAAEVFAQNYPGGRDAFIAAMNAKANDLNLTETEFVNPTGLDGNGIYTTARDLARVAEVAMKDPRFAEIVGTKEKIVQDITGKLVHKLQNVNVLLGKVDGVLGVKTGWTENARENLVTYYEKDGKKIMIVVLGSQDRFGETEELLSWINTSYDWQPVRLELY
jgi:D-alanyl-D-alanine carboxypeptidase (penicillin-binding protein 5/6)